MSGEPLRPFAPPANLPDFASFGISEGTLVVWGLLGAFLIWAVYTAVVVYHWLKYSHSSSIAFPAMGVHALVSFGLMMFALTGALPI